MARVRVTVDFDLLPAVGQEIEDTVEEIAADVASVICDVAVLVSIEATINSDEGDDGRSGISAEAESFAISPGAFL